MKLGLHLGYSGATLDVPVELVQRAEELGYDSVWTAEAYGSDAVTPLAFLAGKTSRIKLGTAIMQLAARTPANAAMSAATVDALAGGGRFIAGIGVSGPQIVEGWYGQPWGKPYWRIKDYVAIMRKIFAPRGAGGARGPRDQPALHGARRHGRRQAAEIDPAHEPRHPDLSRHRQRGDREAHRRDRRRLAAARLRAGLDAGVPAVARGRLPPRRQRQGLRATSRSRPRRHVEVDSDVKAALAKLKPEVALYVGGMGHRDKNFHKDMMIRRGFGEAAERIQELYLAHRKEEATAAVPDEWVDLKSLVGPPARIKQRFRAWEDSGATGLTVRAKDPQAIEVMADAARLNRG